MSEEVFYKLMFSLIGFLLLCGALVPLFGGMGVAIATVVTILGALARSAYERIREMERAMNPPVECYQCHKQHPSPPPGNWKPTMYGPCCYECCQDDVVLRDV